MPSPFSVFPVTLSSTFSHRIQAHSLFHTQPSLHSRSCNSPSLLPKRYKMHLSCHFSVRTDYSSTLQQKLEWLQLICNTHTTPIVNLSPTQSPNIKILFKRDSSCTAQTGTELSAVRDRGCNNTL